VLLLSVEFVGCLEAIQGIVLAENAHFSDGYFRHYLEVMIARWSTDVHASAQPSVPAYRTWSMQDASSCAALLKRYAEDFMLRAQQGWTSGEKHLIPFTAHPHSLFFNDQGPYRNMKNQEGVVSLSPQPQAHLTLGGIGPPGGGGVPGTGYMAPGAHTLPSGTPTGTKRKIEVTKHCMWAMAGILGMGTLSGKQYGCSLGANCPSVHEAVDAADVSRLLTKEDFQSWNTAQRVKVDMAAALPNFDHDWL
jgi:hypothetical protein